MKVTDPGVHTFAIITASDSAHFGGTFAMISSIHEHLKHPTIIVYNLGMSEPQLAELAASCGVVIREFAFSKYPDHVRNLWTYAWKPLMVHEALNEWPAIVWLDSSMRMKSPYVTRAFRKAEQTDGFVMFMSTTYSTYSGHPPRDVSLSAL